MSKLASYLFLLLGCIALPTVHGQTSDHPWTLRACIDHAIKNNISVEQGKLDFQNSEYEKTRALGRFLPGINANLTHSWNLGLTQNITTGILQNQTTQNSSASIGVGIDIFKGLQNLNNLHRANLLLLANQYQIADMKDDVSLFVSNAYLQILFNKETLKVFRSQQEVNKKELEATQQLIDHGRLPQGEIYQLQANIARQEQRIVQTENDLMLSKIALAQLLRLQDYVHFDVAPIDQDVPETEMLNLDPKRIYTQSLEHRNDIKLSATNLKIAQENYEISKGGILPTLSGFYQFDTRYTDRFSTESNDFFEQFRDNRGHTFGLRLSIPIFNKFNNAVNINKSIVDLKKAELSLTDNKQKLENQVYQAYADAQGAYHAYQAAEKSHYARQQAHDYAKKQFDAGILNSFDFISIRQDMDEASSDLIRTKYDYIFKLKVLEFYFGVPIYE